MSIHSQGRPVDVEVVSISRAGQDPGLKKQNQDNCFAYDFYVTPDQSLFSALDGHGPNGAQMAALLLHIFGLTALPIPHTLCRVSDQWEDGDMCVECYNMMLLH